MGLLTRLKERWQDGRTPGYAAPDEAEMPAIQHAISRALKPSRTADPKRAAPKRETAERLGAALGMVEAAILAIDHISELLDEGAELCESARSAQTPAKRAAIAERYAALLERIDAYAVNAGTDETNLIGGARRTCEVALDADGQARAVLHVANLTSGEAGLGLSNPGGAFAGVSEIDRALAELNLAKDLAQHTADLFADTAAVLAERRARLGG